MEIIMSISIQAVYENGILRPLIPLTLPEHTQVQLTVETAFDMWAELDEINQYNPVEIELPSRTNRENHAVFD